MVDFCECNRLGNGKHDMVHRGVKVIIGEDRVFTPDDYSEKPVTAMWLHFEEPIDMKDVLLALSQAGFDVHAFSGCPSAEVLDNG